MNVLIIDSEQNNKKIAEVPVKLHDRKYIAQSSDYFDVAWRIAIDEGIVQKTNRSRYLFSFKAE